MKIRPKLVRYAVILTVVPGVVTGIAAAAHAGPTLSLQDGNGGGAGSAAGGSTNTSTPPLGTNHNEILIAD